MLKSLFKHAGNFLIGLSEIKTQPPAGDPVDRREEGARRRPSGEADGPKFLAGSIHFLNLRRVRQELGANWEAASAAAHEVVRQAIERNLEPGDSFGCPTCDMYVLCFASRGREAVETRMRKIENEIRMALAKSRNELFEVAYDIADIS